MWAEECVRAPSRGAVTGLNTPASGLSAKAFLILDLVSARSAVISGSWVTVGLKHLVLAFALEALPILHPTG